MVNLVLVSHSPSLVSGVAELARAMTQQSRVVIATAAGTGDPLHPLGTNADKIHRAIEAAYSEDGVLVLMDLGSAILSAEMALEFMPENQRHNVLLCAAPMIEGSIAAAVQASLGGTLQQVAAEAMGALASKAEGLSHIQQAIVTSTAPVDLTGAQTVQIKIENRLGLHARPAALFVQTAARFKSEIQIARTTNEAKRVNAKSINAVGSFGVRQNEVIKVFAAGSDAFEALAALQKLAAEKFGEDDTATQPIAETAPRKTGLSADGSFAGVPASPGYAIGPAMPLRYVEPKMERRTVDDTAAEWARLQIALDSVRDATRQLRDQVAQAANSYDAAIFDAHLMFLTDPDLLEQTRQAILGGHINAEWAWQTVITASATAFEAIDDEYMRQRAADVRDIGRQVLARLTGQQLAAVMDKPGILVAVDLAPSDTARLDRSLVLGICTERGGPTSHSAILARTLGIPAVVGAGPNITQVTEGTPLVIDGQTGQVWTNPAKKLVNDYTARLTAWREARDQARAVSAAPAITQDGVAIEVVANIGNPEDARAAITNGAEGVGLLRTEFLFLDRRDAPTEQEQYAAYQSIGEVMGARPVIVRTLDVGGDKPLAYLDLGHEDNPFLGQRAIRLCLNRPDIFKTQLRAILRAAAGHNFKIMFPMIADVNEVRRAKALLAEVRAELQAARTPLADRVDVGIMVEIPAAAVMAHAFAADIDFFSIGTNDLTQYTLAAERGNAAVAHLQDALHPAVLIQIRQTGQAAEAAGKWVGVCGELAGDPLAIPILLGLGVKELSMASGSIPKAKQIIRALSLTEAKAVAANALKLENAEAVRDFMRKRST
jgi:phosphocarrier protein FPr